MFTSVNISNGNIQPTPGPAIFLYALNFIGFLSAAIITIIRKYMKSRGIEKLQIRFIFYGVGFTFLLIGITNFLFVVLLKQSSFVIFGPLFSLILVGLTSYAIVKHKLLNIGLVVARSVAFLILITIILVVYTFVMFGISGLFFGIKLQINQLIVYAILTLFISSTFNPLKNYIEKITDRIFFKNDYSSNELLSKLTKILATNLKLEDLTRKTLNELLIQCIFRAAHSSYFITVV